MCLWRGTYGHLYILPEILEVLFGALYSGLLGTGIIMQLSVLRMHERLFSCSWSSIAPINFPRGTVGRFSRPRDWLSSADVLPRHPFSGRVGLPS